MLPHRPSGTRARTTLLSLAVGDALGMPSQTLTRNDIRRHYGQITGFLAPFDDHPVSHGLLAGRVTDDTEQTLLLARRLLEDPVQFDDMAWARDLLEWEEQIRAKGLRDLLGPSSKAAIEALQAGASPEQTGLRGTTNGAAMRIAPVGILFPPEPFLLARQVARTCRVTHNTGEAIAAAAAVAAVVSAGIAGQGFEQGNGLALDTARAEQTFGSATGEPDMAARIELALSLAEDRDEERLLAQIGSSVASRESVPMAFGLLRMHGDNLWGALLAAANIGDDTDTIGAIVGAMGGATGLRLPVHAGSGPCLPRMTWRSKRWPATTFLPGAMPWPRMPDMTPPADDSAGGRQCLRAACLSPSGRGSAGQGSFHGDRWRFQCDGVGMVLRKSRSAAGRPARHRADGAHRFSRSGPARHRHRICLRQTKRIRACARYLIEPDGERSFITLPEPRGTFARKVCIKSTSRISIG
ncbi:MAG: ADP-ribosylglycohydrolase family protein [Geminicoccaceae bacterium]